MSQRQDKPAVPLSVDPRFALDIEHALGQLQIQARDQLIARAAHDLRSPLNGIQGWTHVLSSRLGQEGGLVTKALDGIRNGVQQQVQIIGDLTDLVHVMTGQLNLEWSQGDAAQLLARAVEEAQPTAQTRAVRLVAADSHAPALIPVDTARFVQALRYILVHCIRCAVEGDTIAVSVDAAEDGVIFQLGTGQGGLAPMAGAVHTKTPAPVLLAERLIDLHGGTVEVFALDDDGIRQGYRVTLPAAAHGQVSGDPHAFHAIASARAQGAPVNVPIVIRTDGTAPQALVARLAAIGCAPREAGMSEPLDSNQPGIELVPAGTGMVPVMAGWVRLGYAEEAGALGREDVLAVVSADMAVEYLSAVLHAAAGRVTTA